MSKIGEILKSEREKRGLTLHEIGMSLKINPKILKAIEEGNNENLPARTFLRGFIRSYAQYLRLDIKNIMELFAVEYDGGAAPTEAEATVDKEDQSTNATIEPEKPKSNYQSKIKKVSSDEKSLENINSSNKTPAIIGTIVLIVLIGFVAKIIEKYQKELSTDETVAIAENLEPVLIEEKEETDTKLESTPSEDTDGGSILAPDSDGADNMSTATTTSSTSTTLQAAVAATTSSTTSSTTTTLKPTTTSTTLTTTTTTIKPTTTTVTTTTLATTTTTLKPTTTTTSTSTTSTTVPSQKPVEIILEATESVTVRIALKPNEWQSITLAAGEVRTLRGNGKVEVESTNAGAISWVVNGRKRGKLGSAGQTVKVSAP